MPAAREQTVSSVLTGPSEGKRKTTMHSSGSVSVSSDFDWRQTSPRRGCDYGNTFKKKKKRHLSAAAVTSESQPGGGSSPQRAPPGFQLAAPL